jgi:hypothetical protein
MYINFLCKIEMCCPLTSFTLTWVIDIYSYKIVHDHWYLILIDVANGVIYLFDSYCTIDGVFFYKQRDATQGLPRRCTMDGVELRKMHIKKIVSIIFFKVFNSYIK